ncbi:MAG: chromophore lyase CpcT/CpeT [Bacteroidota bacterium]|nr:chromophore lyase CpcT/CpeT [Bacteroidota bacterium]
MLLNNLFHKIFLLSLLTLIPQKSFSQDYIKKTVDINALVNMMEGSFSSEDQSKNDTDYYDIRLYMKKIWTNRTDGRWLYVEQASADYIDKPYRQRVYRITQSGDNNFESAVFTFNEPLRFAGEWTNENALSELTPDSLTLREGCTVYLSLIDDTTFQGSTKSIDCESDLRGARYATSEVKITKNEIITWDRGFDEFGKQVWGASKGGYIFKKNEW